LLTIELPSVPTVVVHPDNVFPEIVAGNSEFSIAAPVTDVTRPKPSTPILFILRVVSVLVTVTGAKPKETFLVFPLSVMFITS
jgi:hypothetical protein